MSAIENMGLGGTKAEGKPISEKPATKDIASYLFKTITVTSREVEATKLELSQLKEKGVQTLHDMIDKLKTLQIEESSKRKKHMFFSGAIATGMVAVFNFGLQYWEGTKASDSNQSIDIGYWCIMGLWTMAKALAFFAASDARTEEQREDHIRRVILELDRANSFVERYSGSTKIKSEEISQHHLEKEKLIHSGEILKLLKGNLLSSSDKIQKVLNLLQNEVKKITKFYDDIMNNEVLLNKLTQSKQARELSDIVQLASLDIEALEREADESTRVALEAQHAYEVLPSDLRDILPEFLKPGPSPNPEEITSQIAKEEEVEKED